MRGLGSGVERWRGWEIRCGRDGWVGLVVEVAGEEAFVVGLYWEVRLEDEDQVRVGLVAGVFAGKC